MNPTASAMTTIMQRRENRGQPRHLRRDVALVGGGDVLQHGLELARALADRDHVAPSSTGTAPERLSGRGDRFALADGVARLLDHLLQHGVVEHLLDDLERGQHRHARRPAWWPACARSAPRATKRTSGPISEQPQLEPIDDAPAPWACATQRRRASSREHRARRSATHQ